jgi:hypothetical protein
LRLLGGGIAFVLLLAVGFAARFASDRATVDTGTMEQGGPRSSRTHLDDDNFAWAGISCNRYDLRIAFVLHFDDRRLA